LTLDDDEIDEVSSAAPNFWEANSHDARAPLGFNGVNAGLVLNEDVFPVQSRRLANDTPKGEDIATFSKPFQLEVQV
jgi:hypothetical protein